VTDRRTTQTITIAGLYIVSGQLTSHPRAVTVQLAVLIEGGQVDLAARE